MKKYEKKISLNIPQNVYENLVSVADQKHIHRSDIIRYALVNQLEQMTRADQIQQRETEPAEMYFL